MTWIFFPLLAAFIWAVVNMIDKYVLTKWVEKPSGPLMILGMVGILSAGIIYLVNGFDDLSPLHFVMALFVGVFSMLMTYFYFKSIQIEEVSRVIPLFYVSPIFISILAAIFLGETFPASKYAGIGLVVLGAVLVSLKKPYKLSFGMGFWFMILSAFCMAINQVLIKYLLDFADFWTVFSWGRVGVVLSLLPLYFTKYEELMEPVRKHGKRVVIAISASEVLNVGGILALTAGTAVGYVTLVNALASVQPLFVLLIATLLSTFFPKIIKEEASASTVFLKFVAIVVLLSGVYIIS